MQLEKNYMIGEMLYEAVRDVQICPSLYQNLMSGARCKSNLLPRAHPSPLLQSRRALLLLLPLPAYPCIWAALTLLSRSILIPSNLCAQITSQKWESPAATCLGPLLGSEDSASIHPTGSRLVRM
jgi:hypothetical protein